MTKIFCCNCEKDVDTNIIYGDTVYPHRKDLKNLKFFQCKFCLHSVGTHKHSGEPLGVIPTVQLKERRQYIHSIMDPLWRKGTVPRKTIYKYLSKVIGRNYHTADLRSIDETDVIINAISRLKRKINNENT